MTGFWRFLWKEMFELRSQPVTLVGLFLLPLFLIFAVGQLNVTDPETRVLLIEPNADAAAADMAEKILGELHRVTVIRGGEGDNLADVMGARDADLALLQRDGAWVIFERSATEAKHAEHLRVAQLISWSLAAEGSWLVDALQASQKDDLAKAASLYTLPGDNSRFLVPRTLGLIIVFLPFVLACRSYVREAAYKTLPILLASPRGSWRVLLAGKIAASIWLTSAVACFLLLCIQQLYGFHVKTGLLAVFAVQLLAMFTSTCLGLFVSVVTKDHVQAYLAAAVYFLALVMLTDLLGPLDQASAFIQAIAHLLPLTFSSGPLVDWMFFGIAPEALGREAAWLTGQAAIALLLLAIGSYVERRRL